MMTHATECACGFAKPNRTRLHPVVSVPCVDMLKRHDEKPGSMRLLGRRRKSLLKYVGRLVAMHEQPSPANELALDGLIS